MPLPCAWRQRTLCGTHRQGACPDRSRVAYALEENGGLAKRINGSVTVFHPHIPYADMAVALAVLRLVRSTRSQALHVHTTMDLPYAAFAKTFRPSLRVVYTKQMQPGKPKKDPFHRWVYGKIDLLLAATEQMRARLVICSPWTGHGSNACTSAPRFRISHKANAPWTGAKAVWVDRG